MSDIANEEQHGARIYLLRPGGDAIGRNTNAGQDMNARRNTAQPKRGPRARGQLPGPSHSASPDVYLVAAVLDVQKQLGEIRASLQALAKTVDVLVVRVDTLTSRVDTLTFRVDDITAWKNKILGGAVVAGVVATLVLALLGAGAKLFYDAARQPRIPLARPAVVCMSEAVAQHGLAAPRVAVCPVRSDAAA